MINMISLFPVAYTSSNTFESASITLVANDMTKKVAQVMPTDETRNNNRFHTMTR